MAQSLAFGLLFVLAAAPCGLAWLDFGAALQRLLRNDLALRLFNVAMGVALAGSALLFLST